MSTKKGWIGVDLDGTLAHYDGWKGYQHIGAPQYPMVLLVKAWLAAGEDVRIFTARAHGHSLLQDTLSPIHAWCEEHIGVRLPVTNVKDFEMRELWDDRSVRVTRNSGGRCGEWRVDAPEHVSGMLNIVVGAADDEPCVAAYEALLAYLSAEGDRITRMSGKSL